MRFVGLCWFLLVLLLFGTVVGGTRYHRLWGLELSFLGLVGRWWCGAVHLATRDITGEP